MPAHDDRTQIQSAEVVLPCSTIDPTLAFFTERLGFRIEAIFPADDPATAVLSGHGLRLRLQRDSSDPPATLRLLCREPTAVADGSLELTAPNGTRIQLVEANPALAIPPLCATLVISRFDDPRWVAGRAGMLYRDLIPGRQGGRFVASHIRIADGGDVPDYVHFHHVRFQMIYCYKGWVRVAYQDQGEPIVMRPGDLVLQPPGIRHRVLECSDGLEVIEVSCPAAHETIADHELALPTEVIDRERDFCGQRFLHHRAPGATWGSSWRDGFEATDMGMSAATAGAAEVRILRFQGNASGPPVAHDRELLFTFVLQGTAKLCCTGRPELTLATGDALTVPAGLAHRLTDCSPELELLEVVLPAG